jgi:hypothetical protein
MKCLVPTCQKQAAQQTKGLCLKCYSEAKKKIEHGVTSWDELAELGLAQQEKSEFEKALEQRRDSHANR